MNWQSIIKYIFNSRFGFILKKFLLFPFHFGGNLHLRLIHGNEIVKLLNEVRKETDMLLTNHAAFNVYSLAQYARNYGGNFAEVGVYKGGTAKLICETKGNKTLHLFDTFDGLPNTKHRYDEYMSAGQLKSSFVRVKKLLRNYDNVNFYVGAFPETAKLLKDKFCFVHLDADFYQSTKDGLEYFYPKMSEKGIILIHDYLQLQGVKKAVDEFTTMPIVLSTGQALIVK